MNTLRYGPTNTLTTNLAGQTIGQVLGNANFRAALGFGSDVVARVSGSQVSADYSVRDGETIDIENKAQEKAAGVRITLRYGPSNALTVEVPENSTLRSVLTNHNYRAALGFSDGVTIKVNGAVVTDEIRVQSGMTVDIETRAQEKAA